MYQFPGLVLILLLAASLRADSEKPVAPAPAADRVHFPDDYQKKFAVLRKVNRADSEQLVTVYGNKLAASVTRTNDLPFPYGSIIVMETAAARKDAEGKLLNDEKGMFQAGKVTGLHVMRREKGFGES